VDLFLRRGPNTDERLQVLIWLVPMCGRPISLHTLISKRSPF